MPRTGQRKTISPSEEIRLIFHKKSKQRLKQHQNKKVDKRTKHLTRDLTMTIFNVFIDRIRDMAIKQKTPMINEKIVNLVFQNMVGNDVYLKLEELN